MKRIILILLIGVITLLVNAKQTEHKTHNPLNTMTLTEYYDYECPHCRQMNVVIEQLRAKFPNLKVNYRVVPLLNANSKAIAQFALATKKQHQWQNAHQLLMQSKEEPTVSTVEHIVGELNLDKTNLFSTMQSTAIQQQIQNNIDDANQYAIQGALYLPIFVFQVKNNRPIVLRGEQPYALLAAVAKQFSEAGDVPQSNSKHRKQSASKTN